MPVEFLGKEISVTLSEGEVRQPNAFKLGPKSYKVKEVIASWLDNAYGAVPARRRGAVPVQRQMRRSSSLIPLARPSRTMIAIASPWNQILRLSRRKPTEGAG